MRRDFSERLNAVGGSKAAAEFVKKSAVTEVTAEEYEKILEKRSEFDPSDMDCFLSTLPKYMDGETRLGKKEHYQEIADRVGECRKYVNKSNVSTFLLAAIETYAVTSEQLFEHYMAIRTCFKEVLASYKDSLTTLEPAARIVAAYAISRAIDMKVLLAEKYEALVDSLLD